jgi:1-acyl-sn-glycerol-3-phosphate acyltransferase
MIPQMEYISRHPEKYSEEQMYRLDQLAIRRMTHSGNISTVSYGSYNLPNDSGYIMTPNHQGKYDALGIMLTHKAPCSVVIDIEKSNGILVKQFVNLVRGKRMDKSDSRQSIRIIREMAIEAAGGRKFIIFPEGGYENNKNVPATFKPGAFKSATWSKVPIVPVVLIDSYKVFGEKGLKPITTYVYYLKPILYEAYKDLSTVEIAALVQARIEEVLKAYENGMSPDLLENYCK